MSKARRSAFLRRAMAAALTAMFFAQLFCLTAYAQESPEGNTAGTNETEIGDVRANSFFNYLKEIQEYPITKETLVLDADKAVLSSSKSAMLSEYYGEKNVVSIDSNGYAEWKLFAPEDAVYCVSLKYITVTDNQRNPQGRFLVDGEVPYDSAGMLEFKKLWRDAQEERYDARENQLTFALEEVREWQQIDLYDNEGIMNTQHRVYLSKGEHTFRIESMRDEFAIQSVTLSGTKALKKYQDLKKEYDEKGYKVSSAPLQKFQAEKMTLRSEQEIRPTNDRSNPAVEPYHVSKIRLNTISGYNWDATGEWVEYSFTVPESGLYTLSFKFKQNLQVGVSTCRNIFIDGVIPCEEYQNVQFSYSVKWQNLTVKDKNGEDCPIYLEAGKTHTMRLECTPGIWSELATTVDDIYYNLTTMYRQIIMVTSTNPDTLRDYMLENQIMDLIPKCKQYAQDLFQYADEFDRINGSRASQSETLRRMANQLQSFSEKPDTIPARMSQFRNNLSDISNWLLQIKSQPLSLDYFMFSGDSSNLPSPTASFVKVIKDFFGGFIASFTEDYNSIDIHKDNAIEVWINSGREYANVVKDLIEDLFTPETGIHVNLSMVQGAIVEATLAGSGPEVCVEMGRGFPVNLASRGALVDMQQFEGFDDVKKRFAPGATIPYEYNNGCYGIPLSQSFFMMFYRKDILKQLGQEVPQTWQEFLDLSKFLQRKNMEVCLPVGTVSSQGMGEGGIGAKDIFSTLLLQKGGSFYNEDLTKTQLDSQIALDAFKMWTDFYVKYNYPMSMDFNSRFRTGEVPIGVLSYGAYFTLSAAAPEIRGLWDMTLIPGIEQPDGTIDRSLGATGSAISIFKKAAKNNHEKECWKFVEWFTRDDVQYTYATGIEALQGEAGRYSAANLDTFSRLSWSNDELEVLEEQRAWVKEVPEVPGSYFVSRCIDNAFREVKFNKKNPREMLDEQNKMINEELARKYEELMRVQQK